MKAQVADIPVEAFAAMAGADPSIEPTYEEIEVDLRTLTPAPSVPEQQPEKG